MTYFTEEQWEQIQKFDTHANEQSKKYTKAEKFTFFFCAVIFLYLIFQVLRVVF